MYRTPNPVESHHYLLANQNSPTHYRLKIDLHYNEEGMILKVCHRFGLQQCPLETTPTLWPDLVGG